MNNEQIYEVPLLNLKDIAEVLNALQIPVEEMQRPSAEYARKVYGKFMEKIFDSTLDELSRPKFISTDIFEHPELHEISTTEYEFRKQLKFLFNSIGVYDFSVVNDLMKPEPKRFRQLLSALINFTRFRQKRIDKYEELRQESEKVVLKKEKLLQEHRGLSENVQKIRMKKDSEKPEINRYEKSIDEMTKFIQKLNTQQLEIQSQNKEFKRKNSEISAKIDNDKQILENLKRENENLRSQIVQNPELLKKKIHTLAEGVEDLKTTITKTESKILTSNKKIENNSIQIRELNKCVEIATECDKENNKINKMIEDNKLTNNNIDRIKEEKEELTIYNSHLNRQLTSQQEKFDRLRKQHEEKTQAKKEVYQDILRERQMLIKNREEYLNKVEINKEKIMELKMILEKMNTNHQIVISELMEKYEQLDQGLNYYHSNLESNLF